MRSVLDSLRATVASLVRSRRSLLFAVLLIFPVITVVVLVVAISPALNGSGSVPVAVVNLDEGATRDGVTIHAGEDLVDSLENTDTLLWSVVDEQDADAGLEDGTYAFALKVPKDYSAAIASLTGDDPHKATVEIVSSGATNVLATRAGSAALQQLQARLRGDAGEDYLVSVLNDVQSQASKLTLTADGATLLDEGYDGIIEGSEAIADGLDQTATGAGELVSGLDQIAQGSAAAAQGASALGEGIALVRDQAATPLAQGAGALAEGLDAVAETTDTLGQGIVQSGDALAGVADTLSGALEDVGTLGSAAARLSQQGVSLGAALASAAGVLDTADTSLHAAASGAEGAWEGVAAVQQGAQDLLGALDGDGGETAALTEELAGIDARTDELMVRLRELALDATLDEASRSEQVAAIDAELEQLAQDRTSLAARVQSVEDAASSLAEHGDNAAEGLEGVRQAQADLDAAVTEFEDAKEAVNIPSQEVARTLGEAAGAAADMVSGIATAQATLAGVGEPGAEGSVTGLADVVRSMGQGVSAIAEQLSSTGAVGSGASGLATGAAALGEALTPLAEATGQLATGNVTLATALDGVAQGASGLGTALSAMSDASGQIASGTEQLKDASGQIGDSMSAAGDNLGALASERSERAEAASSPVTLKTTRINAVDSRTSVAPACIAVALWSGALLSVLALPPIDMRAVVAGDYPSAVCAPLLGFICVGFIQALLCLIATVAAGVSLGDALQTVGALVLAAVCFACIAQAACSFGRLAGAGAMGLLLALQLVCAGGILPDALSSGLFRVLGEVLPLPALAEALRFSCAGVGGHLASAAPVLIVWALIAVAATIVRARSQVQIRPERAFRHAGATR